MVNKRPPRREIFLSLSLENTNHYLRWTDDFDSFLVPSKAMNTWHWFCFENEFPLAVGQLTIEFDLDTEDFFEAPAFVLRLFADVYRIESARTGLVGEQRPLPILEYLSKAEIILHCKYFTEFYINEGRLAQPRVFTQFVEPWTQAGYGEESLPELTIEVVFARSGNRTRSGSRDRMRVQQAYEDALDEYIEGEKVRDSRIRSTKREVNLRMAFAV